VDAVPSSINLVSRHHFGAVAVRRDHLRVGFIAGHEVRSRRVSGVERVGPHRVGHHVSVHSMKDLDMELLGWLSEAQAMQGHSRKASIGEKPASVQEPTKSARRRLRR
jgi:hypothetical protein